MEMKPDEEDVSRRDFLGDVLRRGAGVAIVIVAGETVLLMPKAGAQESDDADLGADLGYDPRKHHYVYLIDVTKCIGCGSCVRACELENDVPKHHFRTWIERYEVSRTGHVTIDSPNGGHDGFPPEITGDDVTKAFFVPKMCNHCANTPCVQLCPVGASFISPEGVVLVDGERCIGCSYCVQACPYGSRFIHPETHTASKCTLCYHRITRGLLPACVQACPRGVRKFGDTKALHDEVTEIIATRQVQILKPELRTEPKCYYVGVGKEVR